VNKATLTEAGILTVSAAIAASLGVQLADHSVSIAAITATVVFTLTTGMYFAFQVGQGLRTSYFACPAKGCTASIRARGTDPKELARLQALATDHTKHPASTR
jgi:hypothetical protein